MSIVFIYSQSYLISHSISILAFSAKEIRSKRKSQKRVDKKMKMQSLVEMLNDITKIYDKSLLVRQILKHNKVDISLMNWIAWSSSACKKLKRLCTRVFKKRVKKQSSILQASILYSSVMSYSDSFSEWQSQNASESLLAQHVETRFDDQTRLVTSTLQLEKTFRIFCIIRLEIMKMSISREEVQAN
jgi:hypothetical protein